MIREYTPNDVHEIEQLGQALNDQYQLKLNQYSKCMVYTIDEKIVAFVIYAIMYEKAEIIDIVVSEEYKRKKIGSQLIEYIITDCTHLQCENLTLEVRNSNNEAIAFYKNLGFKEASIRKNYYHNGEDALLMVKLL